MAESVLKKLLWRLGQSNEVVSGLIQMLPTLKKFQERELILKLERIEEDLRDIPNNERNKDFFDDWRIMIIMLWSKFCQLDHRDLANESKKRKVIDKKAEKQRTQSETSFSGRSPSGGNDSKRMQSPSSSWRSSSGGNGYQSQGSFPKSSDMNRANCRYHSSYSKMAYMAAVYSGKKCPNCHFEHTNIRDYSS